MRIKGSETKLSFTGPAGPIFAINRVKNHDIEFLGEILIEEYSGEDTPDYDEADMGVRVRFLFHPDDPATFELYKQIIERRKRQSSPTGKFSVASSYIFPDFGRRRVIVPNLFFGNLPLKNPGFKEFVNSEIEARARKAYFKNN